MICAYLLCRIPRWENIIDTIRSDYRTMMEGQLQQWEARLHTIKSITERAGTGAKQELLSELELLEKLYSKGKKQFVEMETLAAEALSHGKTDIAASWNKVSDAFDTTWARIQNMIR